MVRFGWVRVAATAALSAALVVVVPSPAHAADITITGTVTSPAGASDRGVIISPPGGSPVLNGQLGPGGTFSYTGPPGIYTIFLHESSGAPISYSFSGQLEAAEYAVSTDLSIALPVHALDLSVEEPDGDPAAATIQLDCYDKHPAGWSYTSSTNYGQVSGDAELVVADVAVGDDDCALKVEPEDGPIRYVEIPGNPASYTHVVAPGSHITGTLSDGLGHAAPAGAIVEARDGEGRPTGTVLTDASGHYDLEVDRATHTVHVGVTVSSALDDYRLDTVPIDASADVALDLAPDIDTATVHVESTFGDPVAAKGRLSCSGAPDGQSLIAGQYTSSSAPSGTDLTLYGTATTSGQCYLELDPGTGVYQNQPVAVPNGGGALDGVVDVGITVTGQLTVPGITTFTDIARITITPDGHESDIFYADPDGSFTLSGIAAGPATYNVDVGDPEVDTSFYGRITLAHDDNIALAAMIDYLDLYLIDTTGAPGTATGRLRCSGHRPDDPNDYSATDVVRSGSGMLRFPGYAAGANLCLVEVSFDGDPDIARTITLDPDNDTALTLLRNGVLFAGDPTASNDDDGVADALEAFAPNAGDGNGDTVPDYQQADVSSLPEEGGGLGSSEDYVTVEGPAASELETVSTDTVTAGRPADMVAGPPDGTLLPRGYLDFTVKDITPGSTQTVVVHYQSTADFNSFSTRNPSSGAWSQLPSDRVAIGPKTITLTLTDGGPGDVDGAVNGRIRHPGGGTKLDVETPVVSGQALTAPNDKGWYDGNVTVRWTVTDDKDTITAPANTVVSDEGDDVAATAAEVCDRRGNCSVGSLSGLKIDKTKPVVNLTGPANGATYVVGAVPSRSCSGTDPGGSGVPDGGACVVTIVGSTTAVGTVTVTAKATDRAGNTATKTVSYKQVYKANTLSAPAAGSKLKVFKQGSTVVVRVQTLNAAGQAVAAAKAPTWIAPKAKGKSTGKVTQPVSTLKPDTGTVLIKRGSFWEYRWGTAKAKKGKAYVITVRLDDGTTRTVSVGLG